MLPLLIDSYEKHARRIILIVRSAVPPSQCIFAHPASALPALRAVGRRAAPRDLEALPIDRAISKDVHPRERDNT